MRASPVMEHAQLIARVHMLATRDRDLIRADLAHTNGDQSHQSNILTIGLNEDDRARRHTGDIRLGMVGPNGIWPTFGVGEVLEVVSGVVGARDLERFYNCAADRTVPTVIGESAEEGLI